MSVPRDLLVDIPGYGGPQKINGAYTLRRAAADAADGQGAPLDAGAPVQDQPRDHDRLRRLPPGDQLHRRRLRRHRPPLLQRQHAAAASSYATIDVHARLPEAQGPGRARLRPLPPQRQRPRARRAPAGLPAPDPQPAGHAQADERRPRQPAQLAQAVRALLRLRQGPGEEEADLLARQARARHGQAPGPRGAASRSVDAPDHVNLEASQNMLQRNVDEFLQPRRLGDAASSSTSSGSAAARSARASAAQQDVPGLVGRAPRARTRRSCARAQDRFPFYFPTLRTARRRYIGQGPRLYTIRDELGKPHHAYRLVRRPAQNVGDTTASRG